MIAHEKSASPYNRYNRTKKQRPTANERWQDANIMSSQDALEQANESPSD